MIAVPDGEVHIFEYAKTDGVWSTLPRSFCKKSHSDIGTAYEEKNKRPEELRMCPTCEQGWKNDPRSPWKSFISGEGIKVS